MTTEALPIQGCRRAVGCKNETLKQDFQAADSALISAKQRGKGQTTITRQALEDIRDLLSKLSTGAADKQYAMKTADSIQESLPSQDADDNNIMIADKRDLSLIERLFNSVSKLTEVARKVAAKA